MIMYSNEDFENFYVRYKAEGVPRKICMKQFCINHKVPWNLFSKWYDDTRHRIRPVSVNGFPEEENPKEDTIPEGMMQRQDAQPSVPDGEVRIMIDIRMTNGMQIRQRNLSYGRLKKLVENLEGLC